MEPENKDIRFLKGVGEKRAKLFSRLGVSSLSALLRFYPRTYEDWSNPVDIFMSNPDEVCCVKAKIITPIKEQYIRRGTVLYKFTVQDVSGSMVVTLFNNKYLAEKLKFDQEYLFYGKMGGAFTDKEMSSPEIKSPTETVMHPVYHTTGGLTSRIIEKIIKTNISTELANYDPIPEDIREKYRLCDLKFAIENIHFPFDNSSLYKARQRLIFEELFVLQTGLFFLRGQNSEKASIKCDNFTAELIEKLPFVLTKAQTRVVAECAEDMHSGKSMNRLIQGDVGSGKTLVAAAVMAFIMLSTPEPMSFKVLVTAASGSNLPQL